MTIESPSKNGIGVTPCPGADLRRDGECSHGRDGKHRQAVTKPMEMSGENVKRER